MSDDEDFSEPLSPADRASIADEWMNLFPGAGVSETVARGMTRACTQLLARRPTPWLAVNMWCWRLTLPHDLTVGEC